MILGIGRAAGAVFAVVGSLGLASLLAMASPAGASPAPVCPGGATGTCTVTFSTPGVGQSWTVPAGVSSESFTLYGGIGAFNGGDGAKVTGSL
jgi:hypothetical protein